MNLPRIAILGAGPAGLGAAWRLRAENKAEVVVLEQRDDVGGNAGSFNLDGLSVDYGSHRLHPACHPRILAELRTLLGDDLLDRPRHGRIRLRGRWIHFPLKPLDLLLRLPPSFAAGALMDACTKPFRRIPSPPCEGGARGGYADGDNFAAVMRQGLGPTICRDFYFPYALKIWGRAPESLSGIQARRRVSAGSLGKLMRKVLGIVPGLKKPGAGRFYYPRGGFGQISRAIADAARAQNADIRLNTAVQRVTLGSPHRIDVSQAGASATIEADHVWSTIPITALARMLAAPEQVLAAGRAIRYRAMVLIYLVLDQDQFTPFDAHYFPETDIRLTRLSEPKNYAARHDPVGRTILCGELPCEIDDDVWRASDDSLGETVRNGLAQCGLPVTCRLLKTVTRRLTHAYPIYDIGYERHFDAQDQWVASLDRVLTFGRQGLFAHDNTHHALAMAYAAVESLRPDGTFDRARWHMHREEFNTHVVED